MLSTRVLALLLICALPYTQTASASDTEPQTVQEGQEVQVDTVQLPDKATTQYVTVTDDKNSAGNDSELIGCFKDEAERDLPELAYQGQNSVFKCSRACRRLGYKYAGVQASSWCFCGNSYGKHGKAHNCNLKCNADSTQICGGGWSSNVYRVSGKSRTTESIRKSELIGCFKDEVKRDLPELAYQGLNSVFKCRRACRRLGYKYAGVQASSWCFCGNSYGKYGEAHNCNLKCNANHEQICGGGWTSNVYRASP